MVIVSGMWRELGVRVWIHTVTDPETALVIVDRHSSQIVAQVSPHRYESKLSTTCTHVPLLSELPCLQANSLGHVLKHKGYRSVSINLSHSVIFPLQTSPQCQVLHASSLPDVVSKNPN